MSNVQTADLIFPSPAASASQVVSALKQSSLSISNRLRSISEDAAFVRSVADEYGLPLCANERCGSWYIPTPAKAASCYFKSTDGHTGQWKFNLRRLNLHLLDLIERNGGCTIVDSTRRGKSMPDALLKTVPIWCAVLNRALFPERTEWHELYTPEEAVSKSEHSQIERRLPQYVQAFQVRSLHAATFTDRADRKALGMEVARPTRPLRPLWVVQGLEMPDVGDAAGFHPVMLCTASRRVRGSEASEDGYVQGAGDDAEGWSHGLTPGLFWEHNEYLLSTPEESLPILIRTLITNSIPEQAQLEVIKLADNMDMIPVQVLTRELVRGYTHVITVSQDAEVSIGSKIAHLHLQLSQGKNGSRQLRAALPAVLSFTSSLSNGRLLIATPFPPDHGLGIALCVSCLLYDENGHPVEQARDISKPYIQRRLVTLLSRFPTQVNPARETLKAVNAFLVPPPS